jgi:hypothetical protein
MTNDMSTLLHEFTCDDGLHKCVVEDNGRVAYAYLIRDNKMIGDLWLYNQAESPAEPEWRDRTKMPFLNPASFVDVGTMAEPLQSSDDIAAEWELGGDGVATKLALYLHGQLYGILAPMVKPGWCIAVLKDGPLAKRLTPDSSPQAPRG